MDYLKNLHPDPRDNDIWLEESTHTYYINGKTGYTSVTTYVNSLFEKFDADKIIDTMMSSNNWSNNKYHGKTKPEIKELWENNKNSAANAGSTLHLDIEKFYNNVYVNNSSTEYQYFLRFVEVYKHLISYRTEKIIYSEKYKLAGSIDMIFINDKEHSLEIYDWKRVKQIAKSSRWDKWCLDDDINYLPDTNYWHYALQVNIYKYIYNEEYNGCIGNLYLVSLHPENKSFLRIPVADLQDEVKILLSKRLVAV